MSVSFVIRLKLWKRANHFALLETRRERASHSIQFLKLSVCIASIFMVADYLARKE